MLPRRSFLTRLSAITGLAALPRAGRRAISVEATPTVFFGHDNDLSLIRFSVTGSDAPAGRLRIFEAGNRFLGTAGVIRSGDALVGEFWVPLPDTKRITTQLELPGRSPLRSSHTLTPERKWTVHWATIVSSAALRAHVDTIAVENLRDELELLHEQRFLVNPIPESDYEQLDLARDLEFLAGPLGVAERYALPLGRVALFDPTFISPVLPVLMRGAGVQYALTRSPDPIHRIQAPGGVRVLGIGLGPLSKPADLNFARGSNAMAPQIERLLAVARANGRSGSVLVADSAFGSERNSMLRAVDEWNGRFAFPHIAVSDGLSYFEQADTTDLPVRVLEPREVAVPTAEQLERDATARIDATESASRGLMDLMTAAAGVGGIDELAGSLALPTAGLLVFNPSPFARSDVASRPDGREFVATDIPPNGYAFIPGSPVAEVARTDRILHTDGGPRISINPETGSIESLTDSERFEWIPRGPGWNSVVGSRVEEVRREIIPGLGTRFTVTRFSSARGELRSVITVYDELPWIDISNECEAVGIRAVEYRFPLTLREPLARWDLTVDEVSSTVPVGRMVSDRFIELSSGNRAFRLRCFHSRHFMIEPDGTLLCFAPRGRCNMRIAISNGFPLQGDARRFGRGADPLQVLEVPGSGNRPVPTFGSILTTDRLDVIVAGIKAARNGNGFVVYLQDLRGTGDNVTISGRALRFGRATACDLLERDSEQLTVTDGSVTARSEPGGYTAIRISEISVNRG